MRLRKSIIKAAALAAFSFAGTSAFAGSAPTGLWYDETGRGAVEITTCGSALCGKLVWLKDEANRKACGTQILGSVKPVADGKWDGGWIYDPEDDAKYSVEITTVGSDRLKVMGYAGSKLLSETMIWRRAPADLKRCHS